MPADLVVQWRSEVVGEWREELTGWDLLDMKPVAEGPRHVIVLRGDCTADYTFVPRDPTALTQGQRPLTCCSSKDFQHEVVAPPATAAFHGYTLAARMLLQQ